METTVKILPKKSNENVKNNNNSTIIFDNLTCKLCDIKFVNLQEILCHEMMEHININDTKNQSQKLKKRAVKKKIKKSKVKNIDLGWAQINADIQRELRLCDKGYELSVLSRILQRSPDEMVSIYEQIGFDIEQTFKHFSNFTAYPFGSTISGLGFRLSDIDIYLDTKTSSADFDETFKTVKTLLSKNCKFTKIFAIPRARVPIIKCIHKSTQCNIDLNISSEHGVHSSQFLVKLIALDPRIHPVMLVIKFWALNSGITGTGRLSNYCLILLVIFYLQNRPKPLLPPTKIFLTSSSIDNNQFEMCSNFYFNCKNQEDIHSLIMNFFHFYEKFDFSNKIISLFTGEAINRKQFESQNYKFPEYDSEMLKFITNPNQLNPNNIDVTLPFNSFIVVQDPFFLNQNKAKSVQRSLYLRICKQIEFASATCNDAFENMQTFSTLLLRLFFGDINSYTRSLRMQIHGENKKRKNKINKDTKANSKLPELVCILNPLDMELFYVRTHTQNIYPGKNFDIVDINKFWIEKVSEFIEQLLVDIYRIRVIKLEHNHTTPTKARRCNNQTDVHNNLTKKFSLTTNVNLWTTRTQCLGKDSTQFLEKQLEWTNKQAEARAKMMPVDINCQMNIKPCPNYSGITITIDYPPQCRESTISTFFNEFTSRLRPFLKAYFNRLLISFED